MRRPHWGKTLLKVAGFLLVIGMLVKLVRYDMTSISYFSPMEKVTDFTTEDFYQLVADGRSVKHLGREIVIVNIGNLQRSGLAELIEQVDYCRPAAIGLDVFFDYPSGNDTLLLEAIAQCRNLVAPVQITYDPLTDEYTGESGSFFYPQFPHLTKGAVNLAGSNQLSVVREFRPYFVQGKDTLPHLATALLQKVRPKSYAKLMAQDSHLVSVNYHSHEFRVLEPSQVLSHAHLLKGAVVLIGSMDDPLDAHLTPTRAQMPGVLIHAYSLGTVLYEEEVTQAAAWVNWAVGIILCLFMLWVKRVISSLPVEGLLMRFLQFAILYLIVVGGYQLYIRYGYCLDLSLALLMVGLGFVAADIWESGSWLFAKGRTFMNRLKIKR